MYLDDYPPIAGGRELWGFPKKLASPELRVEKDTLGGILRYGPVPIAVATMGYKHRALSSDKIKAALSAPNFLLKIIPHVDGSPRICELVRYVTSARTSRSKARGKGRPRSSFSIMHLPLSRRCQSSKWFPACISNPI
jgi:acetoacetate decarboxylase